ncbi:hypothetical protein [Hyphococcus sp.]|uniref:hypothetical protein n=1 Tax=Hyphococcus sp. TaxID=2038636 RepID=UPI0035C7343A
MNALIAAPRPATVPNSLLACPFGNDRPAGFSKPFLPESLARIRGLFFLSNREQRLLNQIRGHGYLYLMGLAEAVIVPLTDDRAGPRGATHIRLFNHFREEIAERLGTDCEVIGPAEDIAAHIAGRDPLAASLTSLAFGWMSQRHYAESVRDDASLYPHFKSLLQHRWMEVMQHDARRRAIAEGFAAARDGDALAAAIGDYLQICSFLDGKLKQQTVFDLATFERAAGRALNGEDRADFLRVQHQAMRWSFIGSGLSHPTMRAMLEKMSPAGADAAATTTLSFC